ncbi:MAG: hypothetical protein V7731_10965 [Amphritea sp.]
MQRSEALVELSKEHHHALVFSKKLADLGKLQVSERSNGWLALKPDLQEELLPHFAEEELMIDALGLTSYEPLVARLLEEHRQLKCYLASDESAVIALFAALLKQHVRFEEREFFNWLESQFDEARLVEALT